VTQEVGSKGAFDVVIDGRVLVSRAQTKRIPDTERILELLRAP
jgi:hypothetical protein